MTRERSQSLIASAALHAAVILATLVTWPWARELKIGASVPINIVSNAPSTDLRPAIQDVQDQEAQSPEPVPEPTPEPPQPQPAPTPAPPPTPQPKAPTPAPKAAQPTPKPPPPKPAPKKPQKSSNDFLDSLAADVAKLSKSSGAKGPARAETARQARPDLGSGLSANAVAGLAEELQRRWNPNCAVEGGADVKIPVTFTLGSGGRVVGEVTAAGLERSSDPVKRAAAERAIRAVYQSAPFTKLPRGFYGTPILVNFNAREACS
jgi:outer membrane biosynthesis protein TonB